MQKATTSGNAARALTIGAFDGVHLGHRALIEAARRRVGDDGSVEVLTFDPSPGLVLAGPAAELATLMSIGRRTEALRAAGADIVTVLAVDRDFLTQSADAFIERWIAPRQPDVIVEGPDFRFGQGRTGDLDLLVERMGCQACVVDECRVRLLDGTSVPVRSDTVRWLLRAGRVNDAATLLGRPFLIEGTVEPGAKRGRTIGVPTANLATGGRVVPMDGVYAGIAHPPGGPPRPAGVSIGTNPTFDDGVRSVEAHLLDFEGAVGDYGWPLHVELIGWIRDQVTCPDVPALLALIERDLESVRALAEAADYAVAP